MHCFCVVECEQVVYTSPSRPAVTSAWPDKSFQSSVEGAPSSKMAAVHTNPCDPAEVLDLLFDNQSGLLSKEATTAPSQTATVAAMPELSFVSTHHLNSFHTY